MVASFPHSSSWWSWLSLPAPSWTLPWHPSPASLWSAHQDTFPGTAAERARHDRLFSLEERHKEKGRKDKYILKQRRASWEMRNVPNVSNFWLFRLCVCAEMWKCSNGCLCAFPTSFSWYWLRAQTAPRCQLERPRSGRLSTIKFTFARPFLLGGGFRMVDGALGIQEHQSYYTKIQCVHLPKCCATVQVWENSFIFFCFLILLLDFIRKYCTAYYM